MNGAGFWERILGTQMLPSERKLLMMKHEAIQHYKKNPRELSELKRIMESMEAKQLHIRIECVPDQARNALRHMDGAGIPSETRAVTTMVILGLKGIIEEIEDSK